MKNIIKSLLPLILTAVAFTTVAQRNNLIAVQGGTGHLNHGTCLITLSEPIAAENYFVSITPLASTKGLYVTKNGNAFIVKAKGKTSSATADIDFDYIIYRSSPAIQATTVFKPKMAPVGRSTK